MSIIQGTAKATAGDSSFYSFPIGQSLRFDGSSYLSFTPSSNTNSGLWTYSLWLKLSDFSEGVLLEADPSSFQSDLRFDNGQLQFFDDGGNNFNVESSMLFRDTSAWYHFVVVVNSSLNTEKIKIYVNGSSISFSTDTQTSFTLNDTTKFNTSAEEMRIGGRSASSLNINGYLAEINFLDGQALNPYYFGEFKNGSVWIPKQFDGTASDTTYNVSGASNAYGTNGFRLTFASDTVVSNQFQDQSTNSNHWDIN